VLPGKDKLRDLEREAEQQAQTAAAVSRPKLTLEETIDSN